MPRVTIAVPCYNSEFYLAEALTDLAAQTSDDFGVIIIDNASTDQTSAIAARFVESDRRFSMFRRDATVSLYENFRLALYETDSEFFMWRADDDLSAPNFVACLTQLLQDHPEAHLAGSRVITHKVNLDQKIEHRFPDRFADPYVDTLGMIRNCYTSWFYGLSRRKPMITEYEKALDVMKHNWGHDYLTLYSLIMARRIVGSNDTTFTQRTTWRQTTGKRAIMPTADQWQIFSSFHRAASACLDEAPFQGLQKLNMQRELLRYTLRHTFRLRKMLAYKIRGY